MATYSHSRISCFENCPLQFNYKYVEKVDREKEEGIEAFMGTRVHETLEKLYTDKKLSKDDSLDETVAYYHEIWHKNWHDGIKIVKKGFKSENYYKTGLKCIEEYYSRYSPFNHSKTIDLEMNLRFDLQGYKLTGFIDRLSQRNDGTYEIHDYKTSQNLPQQAYLDEDRQLALYHIGLQKTWEDAENVELLWHYLVFDKEMKSKRTEKQLNDLANGTVTLIQGIENAMETENFPAKESNLCRWCEYQDLCPKHKHSYQTEQLSLNKFMKEPGVKLVNTYRDLSEQKKFIENELDQLKQAVIKYATDNELELIRGSDRQLRVKIEDKLDIPTKTDNPEEAAKLELILKKSDYWPDVSNINSTLLRKALENDVFETDLQKKISKLLIEKHSERVILSNLKEE